jgi:sugar lactone lactonase YvrE
MPQPNDTSAVLDKGTIVRKLEDGFFSISGAAVDPDGKLYFVDHHNQRIYGWSEKKGLTVERDSPLDPVNLAVDKSGNLIVISSAGPESTVYTFRPGTSAEELTVLTPQDGHAQGKAAVILPVNWWNNGEFKDQLDLDTMRFTTLA